ncbi:tetratricopeptide repeat protein [Phenylobacterium sp. VNQ135]|uniref:tetratricopeptide repeat protein n=1 Tax=Phenylobacterium sp. VNQ135 TaxID=3400922 RepID=UPI003C0C1B1E
MSVRDHHGLELSGASAFAAEKFQQALHAYYCFYGDGMAPLDEAIADSPRFVMAHVLKAYMTLIGENTATAMQGVAAFEAAKDLNANSRELGHLAAIGSLLAGEVRGAARILEDVSVACPRDVLALQAGQTFDFLLGDSRMLRDRITRALPAWSEGMPDRHAVLGMLSFGYEETGLYAQAEAAGRAAVALEPTNNWAQHGVAHVLEMQDRRPEGVAWMTRENTAWQPESTLAVHNWWHLALFHLGLGETDEVLRLFDGPIFGQPSNRAFDMLDAAALLWRLDMLGVDVGDRWTVVSDTFATEPFGASAFVDSHAVMAHAKAGRMDEARAVVEAQDAAISGPGDNAYFAREVGKPLCQAYLAFAQGDHARTCELLRGVRNRSARFGGSHAQRDVIDLTLIAAAGRSGDQALKRALEAERAAALPHPELAARLAA